MNRFLGIVILSIVLILAGLFYYRYYYVFGEGVKSGELNFVVKKGYLFKTYEGKLIQSGFKSKVAGTIQSNEFDFSVTNERIAQQLMLSSGKEVDLHYHEYLHAIPWRGYNKYVVDSIIAIRELR
jgi:hypothetical protein